MRTIASTGLSLGLASMVSAVMYGYNHVPFVPDTETIAGAFENVDDIKLLSPAFVTPDVRLPGFSNGTQGSSSQDDMEEFLEQLADRNDYMTYRTANFTSEEGRSFPYIHLSSGRSSFLRRDDSVSKVRVWIQGAVHGNEPAGDETTLALLGKFDDDQEWAASILDKLELVILPRYNPDGVYYFQRTLATNYDPNRDHIKLARQQTRDIKQLMNNFNPHVIVDMHEYGAPTRYGEGQYVPGSDGLYSAAKNLNINERIRSLSEKLFAKNIGKDMEAAGLRAEPYVTGSSSSDPNFVADFAEAGTDGKIGRNAMGLTQAVVFLLEMRGIAIADQEFQRRTAAGLTMLGSIVQTAADNADKVLKTIEGGIKEFIASDDDIIVTDYSKTEIRPFTMVDVKNGSVVHPPVRFASTTPALANLTRSRPEAYLIPVAWADLAERLKVAGLEVETLDKPFEGTVEVLNITSAEVDTSYYEGVIRVTTTTEASEREVRLPEGSFRVSTRQKNAALAMVALEPENIDSYVSFNIVPVEKSDQYPIFRILS
ncbi:carboxypeptidase 2 [Aspergillus nomiae NRRL 13137]|uniref:Carboxypeptidase M14B n=1 Tax=Aspergillus nomiae NRRL (strain ATCC 15546 / NRRL 13137 / CBS 260.88 / M93) TaxID=1509407 RepID=A0A0L1JD90_ASPN3|nr:carboxypeptidase 2 [Aspergillus nomiae NRRL 13137]KNG89677.1 carboxypeptidase 2 [Aspergillus nomiae NRRL 13137]